MSVCPLDFDVRVSRTTDNVPQPTDGILQLLIRQTGPFACEISIAGQDWVRPVPIGPSSQPHRNRETLSVHLSDSYGVRFVSLEDFSTFDRAIDQLCEEVVDAQPNGGYTMLRPTAQPGVWLALLTRLDHSDLHFFECDCECRFVRAVRWLASQTGDPLVVSDMVARSDGGGYFLLDKRQDARIFEFDLHEVAGRFDLKDKADKVIHVARLLPGDRTKQTFPAFNTLETMIISPGEKPSVAKHYKYKTRAKSYEFVAGAAGLEGHIAIGSESGAVRLYASAGDSKARLKIEDLAAKSRVLALDISPDEQWIVATQQHAVSAVNFRPGRAGTCPFVAKLQHDVHMLSLTVADWDLVRKRTGTEQSPPFANAKFVSRAGAAVAIVASVGPAIVKWPLPHGEEQQLPYDIEFIDSGIIVDHMPLNDSGDVICLTRSDIRIVRLPA
jgi:hypothetical protein